MNVRFEPAGGLRGELTVPADKSISHRAALLGAMASEPVRIENYLHAADTTSTLEAVRALGALVEPREHELVVRGTGLREAREPDGPIDVGNAGTLLRLLPGWLAAQEGRSFTLDGDDSIRRRPVDRIAAPLRQMGAELDASSGRFPPLTVRGARLRAISCELPVSSAQVKSCVLFAALAADGATTVGEPERSRDHTERMLLRAGVNIHRNGRHVTVVNADELADFRELVIVLAKRCSLLDHLHEPLVLASQRCHQPGIAERLRVEQLPFDFRRACDRVGEEIPEAQAVAG